MTFIPLYSWCSYCQTYFSRSCAGTCAVHMQYVDISLLTPISHHDSTQFFSRLVLFCTAEVSFSRVDRCPLGICRCEGCLGSMSGKLSNPCFKSDMIIIIPRSSKRWTHLCARYEHRMNTYLPFCLAWLWLLAKRSKKTPQAMFVSWMAAQLVALA